MSLMLSPIISLCIRQSVGMVACHVLLDVFLDRRAWKHLFCLYLTYLVMMLVLLTNSHTVCEGVW